MLATTVHPRLASYAELFGGQPVQIFPYSDFTCPDDDVRINVLVYRVSCSTDDCVAMVTNGFSEVGRPRRELLQYGPRPRRADAHRLHSAAYAAIQTERRLDYGDTIELPYPAGTAWPNAVLLPPLIRAHSDFEMTADGDPMKLLWHLPLADSELTYKKAHGISALLEGMGTAKLAWIFDEATRPVLR